MGRGEEMGRKVEENEGVFGNAAGGEGNGMLCSISAFVNAGGAPPRLSGVLEVVVRRGGGVVGGAGVDAAGARVAAVGGMTAASPALAVA